jgi:hypothetical protein
MQDIPTTTLVAAAGFVAGIVFGATAQRTNFCTMGAVSDAVLMGDFRRLRAWVLAIALALLGSQALHSAGIVDLYQSIYLTANLGWLGAIVGGLLFGFGMTLAGGCGYRSLARVGAGNLKSLVVLLVLGIAASMTLGGLLALLRIWVIEPTNVVLGGTSNPRSQGIVDLLAALFGTQPGSLRWVVVGLVAAGLLWFSLKDKGFRNSAPNLAAGMIIGVLIPLGWLITGVLGADEFEPVPLFSFSFIAPLGHSLQYLMTFTGATISFGIGSVGGVIVGAFLSALVARQLRLESFADAADFKRHLIGAALMGFGGVVALGCTIGQGVTGMSTLALGSVIAWLAIMAGSIYGIRYLETGSLRGALGALFGRA